MAHAPDNTVASVGEFALIDRLRRIVPTQGPGVTLGLGDDAAVLTFGGPMLATCDIQVEGIHFAQHLCAPEDIGWRAVAVNLSDIAAMGGTPRFLLVSLALPAKTLVDTVEGIYRGIADICVSHGVVVAGGNLSATSGPLVIDIAALGDAGRALARTGARPGDGVWVTGEVGKAAAGRFLAGHPNVRAPARNVLVAAWCRPTPRVDAGKALAAVPAVGAMIDTSDGTASDLLHLVAASGVGVALDPERLPVPRGLAGAADAAGTDPVSWALAGGEDYELLFTARPEFDTSAAALADRLGLAITRIGDVLPEAEGRWVLERGGRRRPLVPHGWDHFHRGG